MSKQPPLSDQARRALVKARERLGLTQRAAADQCGVTPVLLCRLETGVHGVTLATLEQIADALGLRVDLQLKRHR